MKRGCPVYLKSLKDDRICQTEQINQYEKSKKDYGLHGILLNMNKIAACRYANHKWNKQEVGFIFA
jgi:hypothetical protein